MLDTSLCHENVQAYFMVSTSDMLEKYEMHKIYNIFTSCLLCHVIFIKSQAIYGTPLLLLPAQKYKVLDNCLLCT